LTLLKDQTLVTNVRHYESLQPEEVRSAIKEIDEKVIDGPEGMTVLSREANEKFEFVLNLIRDRGHPTEDYEYAKIYSARGMVDSAYYHLEKAVAGPIHWGMSDFMERDPLFENIKDEPEFQRLVGIARDRVRLLSAKSGRSEALRKSNFIQYLLPAWTTLEYLIQLKLIQTLRYHP